MSEQQPPPRFDPQTGQPLYQPPADNGMKPGVVGLIAVAAAVIGLGIGALVFNGDDSKDGATVTVPGRTTDVTISTPSKTVTNTETQVQTVTVNTTEDNTGGDTP
jgi:hypothetical protein